MTATVRSDVIRIRGASTHNLQNVDVDLPLQKLIVVTGVSGSGKSSLAFDTLFAEGQRRYLESVSVHTRTLLKQLPRPRVTEITGMPPTICVDQRARTAPARSTLAVTTEIYDYLRLLYARAGTAHCTSCGAAVASQSVDQILQQVLQYPERTRLMILSPLVRGRMGAHRDVLDRIGRNGFVRARIDGELVDISDVEPLAPRRKHTIEAVIDRVIIKEGIEQRLRESVELAVRESEGTCVVCRQVDGRWQDELFSTKFSCATCNLSFPAPEPRTFSFNSAWGACETCEGFGVQGVVDDSDDITVFRQAACRDCGGDRLQKFARSVRFEGTTLGELTSRSVDEACALLENWVKSATNLPQEIRLVAERTLPDLLSRLKCLQQVGVGYLTLDRPTRTLSGGEYQRARLAACLGTGLHGACFVLDEPTAGLHPKDTRKLLQTLQAIRDDGATVVVVEHDGELMRAADHIVDLGPGAGIEGGRLCYSGGIEHADRTDSPTGHYLRNELTTGGTICPPSVESEFMVVRGAGLHNLRDVDVRIPLKRLVCVTGVSGSGKSSLVMETLLPVVQAHCGENADIRSVLADRRCCAVDGLESIKRVVAVDNSPLGRNRRSCIATYTNLWNDIRKVLAQTRDAKARGFKPGRFSFNAGAGRCEVCKGTGVQDVRMSFLPDVCVTCPECAGKRFNRATLAVRYSGRTAADILAMRVDEAVSFFSEMSRLKTQLETLQRVGLGYLQLGQPASTFSGGESQRVKLASELTHSRPEHTVFVLDEPTSGLHPADVVRLVGLLGDLVGAGHSVLVVEHNVEVIRSSQWVIDIGPGSGPSGGHIVATGTPEQIAECKESQTGSCL